MKILLVRPPSIYKDNLHGFQLDLPLGIMYISGALEERGYSVEILDSRIDLNQKYLLNTYANRNKTNIIWEAISKEIKRRKPDVVGITNQFTSQFQSAVKFAEIVKKTNNRILTVVGGTHATSLPTSFLEYSQDIDIVVCGEGEYVMSELLECYRKNQDYSLVKNIAYRKNGKIILNDRGDFINDLDKLPFPAYHLVNLEKYFSAEKLGFSVRGRYNYPGAERAIPMITSRGCPYGCIFCSIHLHMGRKWRTHSTDYVFRHIEYVKNKYRVNHIHFEDDNINFDIKSFSFLIECLLRLNLTWDTPNGLRADKLDKELLIRCKESGCTYLIIGVESAVPRVLNKIIKKRLDLKSVVRVAKLCKEVGLDLRAFYVIGLPGETKQEIKRTTDFALMLLHKYNTFPHMHVAYPHIGTELYQICQEKGHLIEKLNPDTFEKVISGVRLIQTEDFSIKDIENIHSDYHHRFAKIIRLKLIEKLLRHPFEFLTYLKKILINPFDRNRITEDFVAFFNCQKRRIGKNARKKS